PAHSDHHLATSARTTKCCSLRALVLACTTCLQPKSSSSCWRSSATALFPAQDSPAATRRLRTCLRSRPCLVSKVVPVLPCLGQTLISSFPEPFCRLRVVSFRSSRIMPMVLAKRITVGDRL